MLLGDRYVIVVEMDGNAEETAFARAAEICVGNGYRYFTIESESQTQVSMTYDTDQRQFGGNLYQEMILENNFGRESQPIWEGAIPPQERLVPALRVVFKCYKKNPFFNAYDACQYTDCPEW